MVGSGGFGELEELAVAWLEKGHLSFVEYVRLSVYVNPDVTAIDEQELVGGLQPGAVRPAGFVDDVAEEDPGRQPGCVKLRQQILNVRYRQVPSQFSIVCLALLILAVSGGEHAVLGGRKVPFKLLP